MTSSIYEFADFRLFLRAWIAARPKNGRGEIRRMAEALNVNPAMLSQVLGGDKTLSLEMATELGEFLGLADKEIDYFILLVEHARAGSVKLRARLSKRIKESQKSAAQIAQRIKRDQELSSETRSIYYSSWAYTGIRNLTALREFGDIDAIASRLGLSRAAVSKTVSFLLEHGLCRMEDGRLTYGSGWTHIPSDSPLVQKHHQNWRLRGIAKMEDPREENVFFTSPMSLSREAAEEIRRMIPSFAEKVQKIARPSESEVVRCLNLDWFEY